MANSTEADWDETAPAGTDLISNGDDEVRILRAAVRSRLEKEHVLPAGSDAGGEHLEGSAIGYYEASAPTNKPDGATPLAAADAGRFWLDSDNGLLYYYSGSAWTIVTSGSLTADTTYGANVIPASALVTDLEGAALGITADVLDVKVDGTTIEVATDALQIKALGVDTAQLAASAVEAAKIAANAVILGKIIENSGMVSGGEFGTYVGNGLAAGPVLSFSSNPDFLILFLDPDDTGTADAPVFGVQGSTAVRRFQGGRITGALTWGSNQVQIATADEDINESGDTFYYVAIRF